MNTPDQLATLDEAVGIVAESCSLGSVETRSLDDSLGRVLREPITAPEDQPAFDRSSVDGFAVLSDDDSTELQVVERIRAGEWKKVALAKGQAVQIATGAALPGPDVSIIMKEDVQGNGDTIRVLRRTGEDYTRRRGEDCRCGDVLLAEWTRLTPGALALLASLGRVRVPVTALPRVLHIATGNEIIDPSQTPAPGQIRDSNSTLVRAFLRQWGIVPVQVRAGEDKADVEAALHKAGLRTESIDLLLISGGASVGEHDSSRKLVEAFGFDIRITKTNVRPGKPLLFGVRKGSVAFALPGNPLSHFVCLCLYVRTALERFSGVFRPSFSSPNVAEKNLAAAGPGDDARMFHTGTLAEAFAADGCPRETLWPARGTLTPRDMELSLLPWKSSGDLTCLASANALVRIPPGCRRLDAGSTVSFSLTAPLL